MGDGKHVPESYLLCSGLLEPISCNITYVNYFVYFLTHIILMAFFQFKIQYNVIP